jgi:predicted ATPase
MHRKDVRLHTLTGPVGVGKTRLAIEAGHRLRQEYRDGVYFIDLESVQDPELVAATTATMLGIREARGHSLEQSVIETLADKEILLIYDNMEHLRQASGFLGSMLQSASKLVLLVTSRVCLHVYGEHEYCVSPLPLPVKDDPEEAACVRLFCDRAQAARADFRLTPETTPVVAEICRRLDGLPLAIELAASRIKLFTPEELLGRLERRLPILTQETAIQPYRMRGLESAIAWSYGLLAPGAQALLRRLAIFRGGFTIGAAEVVCGGDIDEIEVLRGKDHGALLPRKLEGIDVDGNMTVLLDHSLLARREASGISRYAMLETIREYAFEQLKIGGEWEAIQGQHAEYFICQAGEAEASLYGPDQANWLMRLELEIDNYRAALTWLLASEQVDTAAHLACVLGIYWRRRGRYAEGRGWLEQVQAKKGFGSLSEGLRARTLQTTATLAYRQGDRRVARAWLEESLVIYRTADDRAGIARCLFDLGWIALDQADWDEARRLNQESLALAREVEDPWAIYRALTNLGWVELCTGEPVFAERNFNEAYELARDIGHTKGIAVSQVNLGWIAHYQEAYTQARTLATESLRLCRLLGEKEVMAECLEILAIGALAEDDAERGIVLSGAAQAIWDGLLVKRLPTHHSAISHRKAVESMRRKLPEAAFAKSWKQGQAMSLDAVLAYALDYSTGATR